jgi:hypothetical protein
MKKLTAFASIAAALTVATSLFAQEAVTPAPSKPSLRSPEVGQWNEIPLKDRRPPKLSPEMEKKLTDLGYPAPKALPRIYTLRQTEEVILKRNPPPGIQMYRGRIYDSYGNLIVKLEQPSPQR